MPLGIERITEIVAAEITRQTNTVSGGNWHGPVLQDRDFTNLTLDAVSDPSTTLKVELPYPYDQDLSGVLLHLSRRTTSDQARVARPG